MLSTDLLPLLTFVLVATISPGGATTFATASGVNFGLRLSMPLITGISIGLGSMAALAALGLSTLLLELPALQTGMKALGSAYLLWLAWQTACRGRPDLERGISRPTSVMGGIGLLWVNPKGWAMTVSAAASFASLASGPKQLAALLGATFASLSALSLTLWCVAGLLLAKALRTDTQWRVLNIALGGLLAASVVPIWH